jgi:hypothetical protein
MCEKRIDPILDMTEHMKHTQHNEFFQTYGNILPRVRPEEGLKKRNRIPDFECIDSVSYHRNRIFENVFPVPVIPEPEFGKLVPDPVIPDSEDEPDFRPDNNFF